MKRRIISGLSIPGSKEKIRQARNKFMPLKSKPPIKNNLSDIAQRAVQGGLSGLKPSRKMKKLPYGKDKPVPKNNKRVPFNRAPLMNYGR